jgi:hypothetical protein
MNNEIFLSEYQINNLYALLLIGRGCHGIILGKYKEIFRTATSNYKQ